MFRPNRTDIKIQHIYGSTATQPDDNNQRSDRGDEEKKWNSHFIVAGTSTNQPANHHLKRAGQVIRERRPLWDHPSAAPPYRLGRTWRNTRAGYKESHSGPICRCDSLWESSSIDREISKLTATTVPLEQQFPHPRNEIVLKISRSDQQQKTLKHLSSSHRPEQEEEAAAEVEEEFDDNGPIKYKPSE